MKLYHFTSARHLRGIAKYGLTVGDVPTDIKRWQGRIGVWFTAEPSADGNGLEGSAADKKRYRLTVEVPETTALAKWSDWAPSNVTFETIQILHSTAANSAAWYVYFGVLEPSAIVECADTTSGVVIEGWAEISPPELDIKGVPAWRRQEWQKQLLKQVKRAATRVG